MAIPVPKTSFASGEISPSLFGHADLAKVATAATTMRNGYVDYRGGYKSRGGTAFLNRSKQRPDLGQAPPRIITWAFSNLQGYCLEFGDNYVRFYVNPQNPSEAPAVVTETPFTVSAISNASPGEVTTSANNFSTGDWVLFSGVQGMTILNSLGFIVTVIDSTHFTLEDLDGNPFSTASLPAFISGGAQVSRIYTITSPYAAVDLPYLKFAQSADVMSITCVNPPNAAAGAPAPKEYPPYDLARNGSLNWTLTQTAFGTKVTAPSSCTVTPTVAAGGGSPATLPAGYAYVVTFVSQSTGEESVASPIGTSTTGVDISQTAGSNVINWSAVAGPGYYNIYRAPTSYNTGNSSAALPPPVGSSFYFVGQSLGTSFVDSNITPTFTQTPPLNTQPFARGQILSIAITASSSSWTSAVVSITTSTGSGFVGEVVISSGSIVGVVVVNPGSGYVSGDAPSFSGTGGQTASGTLNLGPENSTYPGVVSYFQQRRFYAQTINAPDTFFMSQTGAFANFDVSNPVEDSDAITGTPDSQTVDGIQWAITEPLGLLTFTGAGVYQIGAPGSFANSPAAITPTNIVAAPQSSIGCSSTVPPLKINWDVLYFEIANNNVLDLTYQIYFNIFAGTDISWPSTHLLAAYQALQWCYSRSPDRVVWIVRNDGVLLSLTYVKEQDISGWARHDTQGQWISCTSVVEPPVNAVYLVAERPVAAGGTRYFIERMNNRIWQTVEDSWCVDAGVATQLDYLDATLSASSASGAVTFTAASSVFLPAHSGQILRMGGGIATITGYTSGTVVTGTWTKPCVLTYPNDPNNQPMSQPFGQWSIAPQVTVVAGLQHLAGRQVVGLADGVPIGPLVPNSLGQVTLPFAASNVVLGLGFAAQLQSVYLEAGSPTVQGRRKAIPAVTARVANSALPQIGANQQDASTIPPSIVANWPSGGSGGMAAPQIQFVRPAVPAAYQTAAGQAVQPLFTGDIRVNVASQWDKPGQAAVQQTLPLPLNVLMFIPEVNVGDVPETDLPPRQQQRRAA